MKPQFLFALLLTVALAGCLGGEEGEDWDVELDDNYFQVEGQPGTKNGDATAAVGETWKFGNEGASEHTVTVHRPPDPLTEFLLDETLGPDETTSFTFDAAGTYHIFCRFHGTMTTGMHLTVTVP